MDFELVETMPEEISRRACKNLIKESTTKRVSDEAADKLGDVLEQWAGNIAQESLEEAREDGRITVQGQDVRKVLEEKTRREIHEKLEI